MTQAIKRRPTLDAEMAEKSTGDLKTRVDELERRVGQLALWVQLWELERRLDKLLAGIALCQDEIRLAQLQGELRCRLDQHQRTLERLGIG